MTVKPLGFSQVQLFSLRCKVRVLEPVSYSQLTKDRAAYDSDKDIANHIYSPTNLIRKISSVGSEVNWMEPSLQPWNSRFLKPQGSDRVCNALHLLQTEPTTTIQICIDLLEFHGLLAKFHRLLAKVKKNYFISGDGVRSCNGEARRVSRIFVHNLSTES
ncbi:hypothetical protein POM88_051228 [Heracleum sosnowskyi]|uniref:Uncharacterized protein n=1 Tax=Heracleum sosnowskyi TaxID=360622 RepID=A0AAD8H1I4_9APIA|nr:hypothetical protein POM88_051228 [Heracleum sosnowskyi]